MKLTRDFYIPKGENVIEERIEDANVVIYRYTAGRNGKPAVAAFGGKRSKPDLHFYYSSEEAREAAIERYVDGQRATLNFKAARRATRKAPNTLAIGSIVYSSWGYDQTNVDFYEVVDKPSQHFVVIRKVAKSVTECNGSSDRVVPVEGSYVSEGKRVKANADNSIKVGHTRAYEWDGEPKHQTAFGFGH